MLEVTTNFSLAWQKYDNTVQAFYFQEKNLRPDGTASSRNKNSQIQHSACDLQQGGATFRKILAIATNVSFLLNKYDDTVRSFRNQIKKCWSRSVWLLSREKFVSTVVAVLDEMIACGARRAQGERKLRAPSILEVIGPQSHLRGAAGCRQKTGKGARRARNNSGRETRSPFCARTRAPLRASTRTGSTWIISAATRPLCRGVVSSTPWTACTWSVSIDHWSRLRKNRDHCRQPLANASRSPEKFILPTGGKSLGNFENFHSKQLIFHCYIINLHPISIK